MRPNSPLRLRSSAVLATLLVILMGSGMAAARAAQPGNAAMADEPAAPGAAAALDPGVMREMREVRAVPEVRDPRDDATDAALRALRPHVRRSSEPEALRRAFRAYYSYRLANAALVTKPYLYYVDLGLDNATARGWVFDMESLSLVDGPFHVAHGTGSSRTRNGVPTRFSNVPGSKASSLGLYLAEETYAFSGRSAGGAYRSVGLRLRGESGAFNDAARARGIVAHGAPYVSSRDAGRSEGCPAMEQHRAQRLLHMLSNGGVVFIFSPNDAGWLQADPWLNAE